MLNLLEFSLGILVFGFNLFAFGIRVHVIYVCDL